MNAKRNLRKARGNKAISARFRKANVALFLAAFTVIVLATIMVLSTITDTVSKDYARLYSTNTSGNLSTHLHKEIALVEKAANSDAVKSWFADEYNQEKKAAALAEMLEIIDVLYSDNL